VDTTNPADELFVVMQQAKLGDHVGLFVRDLKAVPEPAIVVVRDYQLQDLVRFATFEQNFSIATVDPTFCLGEFDVSLSLTATSCSSLAGSIDLLCSLGQC